MFPEDVQTGGISRVAPDRLSAAATRRFVRRACSWIWVERRWLLAIVAFVFAAWLPFGWMMDIWRNPDSSQGYQILVPFAAAYLAWERRAVLNARDADEVDRPYRGFGLLLPSCLLYLTVVPLRLPTLCMAALLLMFVGAIAHVYGWNVVRSMRVPLAFLCTFVPLPHSMEGELVQKMQIRCAYASGALLDLFQLHSQVRGNYVTLDGYRFWVAPACSGLSVLLPLLVCTLWILLVMKSDLLQKLLAFTAAFGTALLVNVLRIVTIGFIGHLNPALGGVLHDLNTWVFTVIALGLNLLALRALGIREHAAIWAN